MQHQRITKPSFKKWSYCPATLLLKKDLERLVSKITVKPVVNPFILENRSRKKERSQGNRGTTTKELEGPYYHGIGDVVTRQYRSSSQLRPLRLPVVPQTLAAEPPIRAGS